MLVAIILTIFILSKEVLNTDQFDEEYPFQLFVKIEGFDLNKDMINVSESCVGKNPGTNMNSVYNLDILLDDLNEATKCYMECILVSIGTVNNSITRN